MKYLFVFTNVTILLMRVASKEFNCLVNIKGVNLGILFDNLYRGSSLIVQVL